MGAWLNGCIIFCPSRPMANLLCGVCQPDMTMRVTRHQRLITAVFNIHMHDYNALK
jgi:hypothetical protein